MESKVNKLIYLTFLLVVLCQLEINAQQTPTPGQQAATTQKQPTQAPPYSDAQKIKDQKLQQPPKPLIYFTEPGIVGFQNGRWIGSDHLYNLSKTLGVVVEIVRLPDVKQTLDEAVIEKSVVDLFKKAGFDAYPLTGSPTPPFPYYHVLIITMPMLEGKIGYVSCRLFEQVYLDRVRLAEGVYWQGITWEKQTLVQASREDFPPHIYNDVIEITNDFISRFKHFEDLKIRFGQ